MVVVAIFKECVGDPTCLGVSMGRGRVRAELMQVHLYL